MLRYFRQLDSILRGDATRLPLLAEGQVRLPVGGLSAVLLMLGVFFGLCMGSFAMIRTAGAAYPQMLASGVKLPALFFLTLVVTFPSLYVFSTLLGWRLSMASALRILVAAMGVMLAVVASLGPIVVFFAVSTTSYAFMVVLNVIACTVAGVLGLKFLLRTLRGLLAAATMEPAPVASPAFSAGEPASGLPAPPPIVGARASDRRPAALFRVWIIVFALVGAQMSWVLRPFIGDPGSPFHLFRAREGNFFLAIGHALAKLL